MKILIRGKRERYDNLVQPVLQFLRGTLALIVRLEFVVELKQGLYT